MVTAGQGWRRVFLDFIVSFGVVARGRTDLFKAMAAGWVPRESTFHVTFCDIHGMFGRKGRATIALGVAEAKPLYPARYCVLFTHPLRTIHT